MSESRGLATLVIAASEQDGLSDYDTVLDDRYASSPAFESEAPWSEELMVWNYQNISTPPPPSLSPGRRSSPERIDVSLGFADSDSEETNGRRVKLSGPSLRMELERHVLRLQRKDGQPVNLGRLWGNFNKRCTRLSFDLAVDELVSSGQHRLVSHRGSCIEFTGTFLPASLHFLEDFARQLNRAEYLTSPEKSLLASLLGRLLMQAISSDQLWAALECQLDPPTFDRVRGLATELRLKQKFT